ncbi:hypothetical protein Tco_0967519 [Tanacetum coccineum]
MAELPKDRATLDEYIGIWFRGEVPDAAELRSTAVIVHKELEERIESRRLVINHLEKVKVVRLMGVNNDVVAKVWSVAEIVVAYDDKVDFIRELEVVPGIDAAVKTVEFLNENLWKDDKKRYLLEVFSLDLSLYFLASAEISKTTDITDRSEASHCCFEGVTEDSQKLQDYRRLSSELREGVRMRDRYISEIQMSYSSDEVLESIEIMRSMQLDDMEKASRLLLMAREIQTKVHEKNNFIVRLRLD